MTEIASEKFLRRQLVPQVGGDRRVEIGLRQVALDVDDVPAMAREHQIPGHGQRDHASSVGEIRQKP
jgi:hypothetical protein